MSWFKKIGKAFGWFLDNASKVRNEILGASATVVAVAGVPVALATAGVAVPAVIVGVATKVVAFGTTAGIVAAKVLPGNGANRSLNAPIGTDPEDPIPSDKRKPGAI